MFRAPSSLRKARLLGLLLSLLLACSALLSFSGHVYAQTPSIPCCNGGGLTYDRANAVSYADNHWNWVKYNDSTPVSAGSPQPDFQCAEFVARALTHGGIVPGLSAYNSDQNAYEYYNPNLGNGRKYDLLAITPGISPTGYDLHDYLIDSGVSTGIGQDLSKAQWGDVVIFTDNNLAQHTAIIVHVGTSTSTTLIDAHNDARYNTPLSYEISGFDSWFIVHITVPTIS